MKDHPHAVRVVAALGHLGKMRRWLVDNCGRRWYATDYRNQNINWRRVGQMLRRRHPMDCMFNHLDRTVMVHFQKYEDMMLFLLIWPGEVVTNPQIDRGLAA